MLYFILAYLVFAVLIAPVTFQVRVWWQRQWRWQMIVHLWGIPLAFDSAKQRKAPSKQLPFKVVIPHVRKLLLKMRWQFAGLRGVVAAGRADQTALLWAAALGILSPVETWLKQKEVPCYIRLLPDFNGSQTWLEGGCILFVRLGSLLASALGLYAAIRKAKTAPREDERIWSTPSGI